MARHLIQNAATGETRLVGDAALPFFPGFAIVDTYDDGIPPAVFYGAGEADLRYVNVTELSDPTSAASVALRAASVPLTTVASSGASRTLDCAGASMTYDVTETANCTYSLTGAVAGRACQITLVRRQDGTGGRTPTFDAPLSANLPPLTTAVGKFDVLTFISVDGGASWQPGVFLLGGVAPAVPSAPTGVSFIAGNTTGTLTWTAALGVPTPTAYRVYRGTVSGTRTLVATLAGTARSYPDSGLTNGTRYYYTVRAVNSLGASVDSAEVSDIPAAAPTGGTGPRSLVLPGGNIDMAQTPNATALNLTGQIELRAKIRCTDYTSTQQTIVAKWHSGAAGDQQYYLFLNATGNMVFAFSTTSGLNIATSTVTLPAQGIADNTDTWVRAVCNPNTSGTSWSVNLYTSPDGTNWTALGTQITGGSNGAPLKSTGTQPLTVGALSPSLPNGWSPLNGRVYFATVINGDTGTAVSTIDFSTKTAGATSFTGATGETWTLNGAAAIA